MQRRSVVVLTLSTLMVALGCNPKVGLIVIDTNPQGATVYVNESKVGETPVKFEFNMEKPVIMRILKEGYQPQTENINVGWVKSEYHQGHYTPGEFMLGGTVQRGYQVLTKRTLIKQDGQAPLPPPPPAPPTVAATPCSEPAPAPTLQVGEKWTWRDEKSGENTSEVLEVDGDTARIRRSNGDVTFYDKDLILRKVHLQNGDVLTAPGSDRYITLGKITLAFPLHVGKSWEYRYTNYPAGGPIRPYTQRRTVVACEEVTTAAGKFFAFRIEAHDRNVTSMNEGKYYLWYAPEVKNTVRRQLVPSDYWRSASNWELVKYERSSAPVSHTDSQTVTAHKTE